MSGTNNIVALKRFFVIAVLIGMQYIFNEFLDLNGIRPDLFFIILIYLAFRISPVRIVWAAFALGLIKDILFHQTILGLSPLIMTFSGYILGQLVHNSPIRMHVFTVISSVLLIFFNHIVFNWALFIEMPVDFSFVLVHYSLPELLYTGGIFMLAIYFIPLRTEEE